MPSNAVSPALSATRTPSGHAGEEPIEPRAVHRSRWARPRRSHVVLLAGVVVAVWLVLVFGRALSELNEATERAAAVRAETTTLEQRLQAAQRELELVQTDSFQALQARAYGLGRNGERAFALAADAPPPPVVVPLGGQTPDAERTPLDSWLRLLFGSP